MAGTPARIQLRKGTAAAWTAANPVLTPGEPGVETDTGKIKIGNGATAWVALPYSAGGDVDPVDFANNTEAIAGVATDLAMTPAGTRAVRNDLTTTWGVLPTNYINPDGTWGPRTVPAGYTGPVTFDSATRNNAADPPAENGDRWLRRKPS